MQESNLLKEIGRVRERLRYLEHKVLKQRYMSEEMRIKQVEAELKAKYPKAKPDRELLSLVGILPNPRLGYKEAIRRLVAERYGK